MPKLFVFAVVLLFCVPSFAAQEQLRKRDGSCSTDEKKVECQGMGRGYGFGQGQGRGMGMGYGRQMRMRNGWNMPDVKKGEVKVEAKKTK